MKIHHHCYLLGDCDDFNLKYPNCKAFEAFKIGDGNCDEIFFNFNIEECGFDGGKCFSAFRQIKLITAKITQFAESSLLIPFP